MNLSMMQTFQRLRSGELCKRGVGAIWVLSVALALMAVPRTWAQDNATITGTATDASGAVVPNANVSLTNTGTGVTRESTVNSVGAFRFPYVGVGTYTLNATAPGYQKFTKTGIVVNVAATLEVNVTFQVGSESQTVTVQADALQVQSETNEISTLISGEQVRQLATNGRNVVQLAALGLGVSNNLPSFGGIDALTSANGISFNGQRTTHNIYLIDGAEQNDRGCGGCFMNLPSQDAIGEFQTLASNYSADYGIGSGGTVVMVLKSGTRRYHGTLYYFNRNTAFNANDYFLKQVPLPRSVFQLNLPGGNIAGPLWIPHVYNTSRNRTFFFWNEEWRRLIKGSSPTVYNSLLAANFPTLGQPFNYTNQSSANPKKVPIVPVIPGNPGYAALVSGNGLTQGQPFPLNPNGTYRIPANMVDQNIVRQLAGGTTTFPLPNTNPNATGAFTQYIASPKQPEFIREDTVRIDHSINSKFQLMGHYLHDAMQNTFYPPLWAGSVYPTVGTLMQNPSYTAAIKLTQTYSSSLLNETAFFYSGNKINLTPVSNAPYSFSQPSGWTATSFFPTANNRLARLPQITLASVPLAVTWNASYFPWKNGYEAFQYRDDVSWSRGHHQFKFGASWLHTYKNQELQANTNGAVTFDGSTFSGDSIVNMMLGFAANYTQLEYLWGKNWVNNNYSGWAIDNYHATSRLTLNIGIRFDGLPHTFERYNKFSNFVPADFNPTLGNAVQADGSIAPNQLSTSPTTGSELFYLNGMQLAGVNGFPRGNVQNVYHTWQPRIGFAYDLGGNGRTVIRGGGGVFYERVQGNDVYNAALNPPFAYQPNANSVYFSNPKISVLTGSQPAQAAVFPSSLTNISFHYPPPGTGNYSLGIQRLMAPSVVAVLQYVGSRGWSQNNDRAINTLPLFNNASNPYSGAFGQTSQANPYTDRQKVAAGTINANLLRIYPGYSSISQEENKTNFNYNSLQTGVRFENRWGLTTQLAYTWSKLIDTATNDLNNLPNPFNTAYNRGAGGFDRRQIFNASYVYGIPFGNHSSNAFVRTIIGGWAISGVTVFQTGLPQLVTYNGPDTLGLGGGTSNRPDRVAAVGYPKTQKAWFTTHSFANPLAPWAGGTALQGWGDSGKDNVVSPGLNNWNLTLSKNIAFTKGETPNIELRFESFNTFNKTQFNGMDANTADSNFGQITSVNTNRVLELGGKFHF